MLSLRVVFVTFIIAQESVDPLQSRMEKKTTLKDSFCTVLFEKIKSTHDEPPFTLLSSTKKSFHSREDWSDKEAPY